MLSELSPVGATIQPRPAAAASAAEARPIPAAASAVAAARAAEPLTPQAVEPGQALDRASRAAARALFRDRDVEVTSFRDEGAGRVVYRVADRSSGEVLLQSPPDALLRYFASAREALDGPLLAVEA